MSTATAELGVGIHHGLSFDDYAAIDAANASLLNEFRRTPAHVRHYIQAGGKDQSPAMELGWLAHLAVFERARFDTDYVMTPNFGDMRTKAAKTQRALFEDEHRDKEIVKPDVYMSAKGISDALLEHETAREFLSGNGYNEVSIVWDDEKAGVQCKARIDRISTIGEWPIVGDLKTTADASRSAVERTIYRFGYHVQAVHYLAGLEALVPIPAGNPFRRFVFFFVESSPPYAVACYELDDVALEDGVEKREEYLRSWRECVTSNRWPGYPSGIEYASIPAWAARKWRDYR